MKEREVVQNRMDVKAGRTPIPLDRTVERKIATTVDPYIFAHARARGLRLPWSVVGGRGVGIFYEQFLRNQGGMRALCSRSLQ